jgi:predicted acylesterase/phospholipase RssA
MSQPARKLLHPLALTALAASVGCTSFGPELPNSTADEISLRGPSPGVRTLAADGQIEVLSSPELAKRLQVQLPERPLSIIAFSGGGAGGAFGAGVLAGLTQNGTRPLPSVVTGVSAGALVAPFAFLGPAWDQELIAVYRDGVTDGLMRKRLFAGLFASSVCSGAPLRRLIARYADDAMIQAIAIESSKGRLLLVATTDFASGEPVIWDLTSIAAHGGLEAKALFRSILLASASVPGMFPPVTIKFRANGELRVETHIDGGVTMPFFIAPAPQDLPGPALRGVPSATCT